jgi:hypothetical protein
MNTSNCDGAERITGYSMPGTFGAAGRADCCRSM